MHLASKNIIATGFRHIVKIDHYHTGDYPDWTWHSAANDFVDTLDLHESVTSPSYQKIYHYKEFSCKVTIQDGDLPGYGILVFFENEEGAKQCFNEWGHHRRPRRYHSYGKDQFKKYLKT